MTRSFAVVEGTSAVFWARNPTDIQAALAGEARLDLRALSLRQRLDRRHSIHRSDVGAAGATGGDSRQLDDVPWVRCAPGGPGQVLHHLP